MKKIVLVSIMLLSSLSFYAQSKALIKFAEQSHNFGTVPEAGSIEYPFTFTNAGTAPLVLNSVQASCGCTTPEWPKEPIAVGQSGVIKVKYNTEGRPGQFTKTITVTSNSKDGNVLLTIQGTVTPKVVKVQ